MSEAIRSNSESIQAHLITLDDNNPRKLFPKESIKELSESIKEHGLIHPILVRPFKNGFKVVCGARRYKASLLAESTSIACTVREMTDIQALELQIIENLDREDVHPLEEALAIEHFLEHDMTFEDIANKLAKSKTFVVQRLSLLNLRAEWKDKFKKNEIPLTVAFLMARLTKAHQKTMLDLEYDFHKRLKSTASIKQAIERNLMLSLDSAVFDTSDENLVSKCASCLLCSKRSGANNSLFPDIKEDNCFDRTCFEKKTNAFVLTETEKIIGEGLDIVFLKDRNEVTDIEENIKKHDISVLVNYDDFRTADKKSKKTKTGFFIDGHQKGNYTEIKLSAKSDNSSDIKVKMSDLPPNKQIERIEEREIRSLEIDQEKIQKTFVEDFKSNPLVNELGKIVPIPEDILMMRLIIWSAIPWSIKDVITESLGCSRFPEHEELSDLLQNLTAEQLSFIVRMSAFENYGGQHPKYTEATILREFGSALDKDSLDIILEEQQQVTDKRNQRQKLRIEKLRKKMDSQKT